MNKRRKKFFYIYACEYNLDPANCCHDPYTCKSRSYVSWLVNISEADGRTDSQTDTTDRFTLPANVVVNNAQAGGFIAWIAGSISIVLL